MFVDGEREREREGGREFIVFRMPSLDSTVNVWVRKRQSYVESHPNATIRVKNCRKMGENLRGSLTLMRSPKTDV